MKTLLALSVVQVSYANAGAFHTIIGPDGRPMVVQVQEKPAKKPKESPTAKTIDSQPVQQITQPSVSISPSQTKTPMTRQTSPTAQTVESLKSQRLSVREPEKRDEIKAVTIDKIKNVSGDKVPKSEKSVQASDTSAKVLPSTTWTEKLQQSELTQPSAPYQAKVQAEKDKPIVEKKILAEKVVSTDKAVQSSGENLENHPSKQSAKAKQEQGFSTMAGEKYVNNEYLEDKEFNLEGKKRFYTMPEGVIDSKMGQTRMQTIEREKGVSRSVIDNLFKRNQPEDTGPITLATSYYRVSQADTIQGLGQQCFSNKKMKKAKELDLAQDINLWPRAPLSDEFDYEVVKLKSPLQNIRIHSFASKVQNPTFYWPFAVFLDKNGCVMEGAGGFKNNQGEADHLYHEKIEGVIQVPKGSQYLFLTPLATAIDVDGRVLTNQGQLKLTAIR
ncbi:MULTISPECIES: putative pilus assembly protein FilE [unclassified Acinetobacter]|uniref:putative pilus assembly protein FilE n=1 Tax=unclassified Acinetobacter TaxID=196816 RepID=UPI00211E027B|nr:MULTISPECIES: putative pilus assembly protein FilE [unclassified Acinetobacter]UUS58229.1 putative pilus assembly protein FilE [Acinetobacter sp. YH16040_T]